jgi:hypothetical protein
VEKLLVLAAAVQTGLVDAIDDPAGRTPEQAAEVIRAGADAAIAGSACVDLISRGDLAGLEELIRGMKAAIGEARPI